VARHLDVFARGAKGLLEREPDHHDGRSQHAALEACGGIIESIDDLLGDRRMPLREALGEAGSARMVGVVEDAKPTVGDDEPLVSPPVSLGTIFTNITGDQVPDHGRSGLRALELSLMSSMAGDRLCESPDVEVPSDRPAIYHLPHRGGVDHLGVAALGEQPSRKLAARPSNVSAPTGGLLGTGDPGDSGTLRRRW
jgi:hypothetical protein